MVGVNGPLYTNVQIHVKITGPATPKLLATDSNGVEHDIAQIGYWGPTDGFAIQGDFTNTTPIKATFTEAGTYTIELILVDLANSNAVITSKEFTIDVLSEETPVVNNTVTNVSNNTTVEELPKTGTSLGEYITYFFIIGTIFLACTVYFKRRRFNA